MAPPKCFYNQIMGKKKRKNFLNTLLQNFIKLVKLVSIWEIHTQTIRNYLDQEKKKDKREVGKGKDKRGDKRVVLKYL